MGPTLEAKINQVKFTLMNMGLNEYQASALAHLMYLGETKATTLSKASGVPNARIYGVLDELSQKLLAIPGEDGRELNSRMLKRVDIHPGPRSEFGPDLFTVFDEYVFNISELVGYENGVLYSYDTAKGPDDGGHGSVGYVVAAGAGIPALGRLSGATLLDIAPTVMSLLGQPVPSDMEGKSLLQETGGEVYSDDDLDEIKGRLAGFGYL